MTTVCIAISALNEKATEASILGAASLSRLEAIDFPAVRALVAAFWSLQLRLSCRRASICSLPEPLGLLMTQPLSARCAVGA